MAKPRSIAMLVALGLAGAAWAAQNPTPPGPADTQAAPPTSPEQQGTQSPDPSAASSPHQKGAVGETPQAGMAGAAPKIVGLKVESPTGESLGTVVDVTMDASRQPEYAVISTGNDTMTAVPYSAVAPMIKDNKVIMDRTRLENSPQVAQSELRDESNTKWRADADKYWSQGAVRTASPGTGTEPQEPKER